MLGHHPEIAFIGEFEWVWDFGPLPASGSLDSYHSWLGTNRHFRLHGLTLDKSLGYGALVRDFFRQQRAQVDPEGKRPHVGCQIHRNYAQALAMWPNARFIHIVRDGRDVCASWINLGWLGNAYAGGQLWRDVMVAWADIKPRIDPSRRIEIHFEALIRSPQQELTRLTEFIGVPYSDAMLRYHEDTTYEPIDPKQGGKWRQQLSRRDVRVFEALAADQLTAYGYALSGERAFHLGAWQKRLLRIEDKLRHHRARIRIYGFRLWLTDLLARQFGMESLMKRAQLQINEIINARRK